MWDDEMIDALLDELHTIATNRCCYEYGLPVSNDEDVLLMRAAVEKFACSLGDADDE